jgi:hypothetical protein
MPETSIVSFDLAAIGRPGVGLRYDVTRAAVRAYAEATDDVSGGPVFAIVPVWSVIAPASEAVASGDFRRLVVHHEQDMLLHRPLEAGMPVVSRATPVAVLPRPNGTSLVIKTETRGDDGVLVNEQYVTEFFRGVQADEGVGDRAPDHRLEADGEPVADVTYLVAEDQAARASTCCQHSKGGFSRARRGGLRMPRWAGLASIRPQATARLRTCRNAWVASNRCPSGIVSRQAYTSSGEDLRAGAL